MLRWLSRLQRPVAWFSLVAGAVVFVGVIVQVIATNEPALTIMVGYLAFQQGYDAVTSVENELNSDGAVED